MMDRYNLTGCTLQDLGEKYQVIDHAYNIDDASTDKKVRKDPEKSHAESDHLPDNWNEDFQRASENAIKLGQYHDLHIVCADFVQSGRAYAQCIIQEHLLPTQNRALATANLGGRAGGLKFKLRGMVFKLCEDPAMNGGHLYGGDHSDYELAAKAAGNELRGAVSVFQACLDTSANVSSPLTTTVMCLIDYLGLRLSVMPLLPIDGHNTLRYGSGDGGKTILADPEFHLKLGLIAQQLHLQSHKVHTTSGADVTLHTAGDVEAHQGQDGRRYLLDLARFFPPEAPGKRVFETLRQTAYQNYQHNNGSGSGGDDPKSNNKGDEIKTNYHLPSRGNTVFYRLLRPELLALLKERGLPAQSGDAWSGWGSSTDRDTHNENSVIGTAHLLEVVIPKYADYINQNPDMVIAPISATIHRQGINVRHLGFLRSFAVVDKVRKLFLEEMVARTLKNQLREKLRQSFLQHQSGTSLKEDVSKFLNLASYGNLLFWEGLVHGLQLRYGEIALTKEEKDSAALWEMVKPSLHSILGYILSTTGIQLIFTNTELKAGFHFTAENIDIGVRVKQFDVMDWAAGKNLFELAEGKSDMPVATKRQLYDLSSLKFQDCLKTSSNYEAQELMVIAKLRSSKTADACDALLVSAFKTMYWYPTGKTKLLQEAAKHWALRPMSADAWREIFKPNYNSPELKDLRVNIFDRLNKQQCLWEACPDDKEMLCLCAQPDCFDVNGNTALMVAAQLGFTTAVKELLDQGADPAARNIDGKTALHFAAAKGSLDIAGLLVVVNEKLHDSGTKTSHFRSRRRRRRSTESEEQSSNSVLVTDNDGNTPSHLASHIDMIRLLHRAGADPGIENKFGHLAPSLPSYTSSSSSSSSATSCANRCKDFVAEHFYLPLLPRSPKRLFFQLMFFTSLVIMFLTGLIIQAASPDLGAIFITTPLAVASLLVIRLVRAWDPRTDPRMPLGWQCHLQYHRASSVWSLFMLSIGLSLLGKSSLAITYDILLPLYFYSDYLKWMKKYSSKSSRFWLAILLAFIVETAWAFVVSLALPEIEDASVSSISAEGIGLGLGMVNLIACSRSTAHYLRLIFSAYDWASIPKAKRPPAFMFYIMPLFILYFAMTIATGIVGPDQWNIIRTLASLLFLQAGLGILYTPLGPRVSIGDPRAYNPRLRFFIIEWCLFHRQVHRSTRKWYVQRTRRQLLWKKSLAEKENKMQQQQQQQQQQQDKGENHENKNEQAEDRLPAVPNISHNINNNNNHDDNNNHNQELVRRVTVKNNGQDGSLITTLADPTMALVAWRAYEDSEQYEESDALLGEEIRSVPVQTQVGFLLEEAVKAWQLRPLSSIGWALFKQYQALPELGSFKIDIFSKLPHRLSLYDAFPDDRELLCQRALPDITDSKGETPLMKAAALGSHTATTAQLVSGADVHATTAQGQTALHFAAQQGDITIVNMLLEHGADCQVKDNEEINALHLTTNGEVANALMEAGSDPFALDSNGRVRSVRKEGDSWVVQKEIPPSFWQTALVGLVIIFIIALIVGSSFCLSNLPVCGKTSSKVLQPVVNTFTKTNTLDLSADTMRELSAGAITVAGSTLVISQPVIGIYMSNSPEQSCFASAVVFLFGLIFLLTAQLLPSRHPTLPLSVTNSFACMGLLFISTILTYPRLSPFRFGQFLDLDSRVKCPVDCIAIFHLLVYIAYLVFLSTLAGLFITSSKFLAIGIIAVIVLAMSIVGIVVSFFRPPAPWPRLGCAWLSWCPSEPLGRYEEEEGTELQALAAEPTKRNLNEATRRQLNEATKRKIKM